MKKQWKSLDEFYDDGAISSQDRQSEFDAATEAQMALIREEYGIDENGEIAEEHAGQKAVRAPEDRDDLRKILPSVSRRGFLRLTGAAAVFGMAGCWHKSPETLISYLQQPEGTIVGTPYFYSSMVRSGLGVNSATVKLYNGRPIKIEGNSDDVLGRGAMDLAGQASILDLYDPDRVYDPERFNKHAPFDKFRVIEGPLQKQGDAFQSLGWDQLDSAVGAATKTGKTALLSGPFDGPSREALLVELKKGFGDRLQHVSYHPFAEDIAIKARELSFGKASKPVYDISAADVVVTIGSDILAGGQTGLADEAGFGDLRRLKGHGKEAHMGQLITFEANMSQTGVGADVRVRASMADMEAIVWTLAKKVSEKLGKKLPAAAEKLATAQEYKHQTIEGDVVEFAAEQLVTVAKAKKHSLVYVGGASHTSEQSLSLYVAQNYLNALLGNEGNTVSGREVNNAPSIAATRALLEDCAAGNVQTLIIADANIAYDFADKALVEKAFDKVKTLVVLADRVNETAEYADFYAPTLHDLESWGDAEPRPGYFFVQQPCILPLWNSRAVEESLIAFAKDADAATDMLKLKEPVEVAEIRSRASDKPLWQAEAKALKPWRDIVRETWTTSVYKSVKAIASADRFWKGSLARGVAGVAAHSSAAQTFVSTALDKLPAAPAVTGFNLLLSASRTLGAGTHANNALLQECPDPVSKITWDNYLALSVAEVAKLKLERNKFDDPVVTVAVEGQEIEVPVVVQPGMAEGTAELFLGWGRTRAGEVAKGGGVDDKPINAFQLSADGRRYNISAQITNSGKRYKLACTQGHHYMDGRSQIAQDDTLEMHQKDPGMHDRKAHHALWKKEYDRLDGTVSKHNISLWDETHVNVGRKWGMHIDMNVCTGCNACVVACSVENNVPVVGRDEVRIGREMHWMRIDRYYTTHISYDEYKQGVTESEKVEGQGHYHSDFNEDFVEAIQQPMLCQQCGHAPCEEVCPAMATMHNDEGQNVQVYNRCIGTRYCANNCPYKVRRFNFYEYSKYRFGPHKSGDPLNRVVKNLVTDMATSAEKEMAHAPLNMMLNPEVTVRSKGVMEKCNFCIARTRKVRDEEKRTNRKAPESMMQSACSQTCPTQAIVFGDINDPSSNVSKVIAANEHDYKVLDYELNTRPSVSYARKVRNRPSTKEEAKMVEHHGDDHGDSHSKEEAH